MFVQCNTCKKDLDQEVNFYKTKKGDFYRTCVDCCRKRSLKYYQTHKQKRKPYYKIKRMEGLRRNTERGFIMYMEKNPHYFQHVFNMEPTRFNILDACKQLI